jgi:hypothetical protein
MILPAQLSKMRLGIHPGWKPKPAPARVGAGPAAPVAYSRIMYAPRVEGQNSKIGDCFPTACANAIQTYLARANLGIVLHDADAVDAYEGMTGYNPAIPATDQGTNPDAGFAWWQANAIAGYKLAGITSIPTEDEDELRHAIAAGGVLLCVQLATEQQNQRVWTATGTPGSWGGHAIFCDGYDGEIYSITSWGEAFYIDRSYFTTPGYVVGAYALAIEGT